MACFRRANGTVITDTSGVDGTCNLITTTNPVSACCPIKSDSQGSGNLCLSDFLCWESGPPSGGSGFLTASCTDNTYDSSECTPHCTDNPVPDVIYNPDTALWACCSWTFEGGVDCSNPTNETFEAPAPQSLLNAASASSSIPASTAISSSTTTSAVTSATTSAPTTSSPSTSSASPSPTASSSAGLSSGAKAGIGIGVAVGAVTVAVGLIFFLLHHRRQQRSRTQKFVPMHNSDRPGDMNVRRPFRREYKDHSPTAVELEATNQIQEAPGYEQRPAELQ